MKSLIWSAVALAMAVVVGGSSSALALACFVDTDCPCGDVCSWEKATYQTCVAASSGDKGWCDTVAELLALQTEYAAWSDSLPDSLRDSATAEALQTICDLDLADLQAINPPRGFGRD